MAGLTDNDSFEYFASSPGGVWGTDWDTNNVYRIFTAGVSASQSPAITPVKVFAYAYAETYAICLGPDGNVWVSEDDQSPEAVAKLVYGGSTSGALAVSRASSTISRSHSTKSRSRHPRHRQHHTL